MTQLSLMVVAVLAFAGCGDDTTNNTSDLATAADMAVAADLTSLGCGSILACDSGCGRDVVCQAACRAAGATAAKGRFDAFAGCVALSCSADGDGGSGACASATDASAGCQACLAGVAAQAPSAGSPCNAQYAACASS